MTHPSGQTETEVFIRIMVLLRREGASVRTMARLFGCSKSTMHRMVRDLERIAPRVLSQMGRDGGENAGGNEASLSQMGQDTITDMPE
jgi:transposase